MANDWTDLLTGMVKTERGDGVTSFCLNGEPYANALVEATAADYETATGRPPTTFDDMEAMVGDKVTILRLVEGMMGHRALAALPGTVFAGRDGPAILPKGKRRNGLGLGSLLRDGKVLDTTMGYKGVDEMRVRVEATRARQPALVPLTKERLAALPSRSKTCSLAVFGTYPFMGDRLPGTVWLCHSYLRDDDIVESVMLARPPATSEYGSAYGADLLRMPVGEAVDIPPVSFADAIELTNLDYEAAMDVLRGLRETAVVR